MRRLTTHVLDTLHGRPAYGVEIHLSRLDAGAGAAAAQLLVHVTTNADGRTEAPLLEGEAFAAGTYELVFSLGPYFARNAAELSPPPFLNSIPVRFIAPEGSDVHLHVPLLAGPWSYTIYRGS